MKRRLAGGLALALALAAASAGCALTGHSQPPDWAPRPLGEVVEVVEVGPRTASVGEAGQPSVALVLGGGGLRGFAHVGALQALEEAGIRPDLVVGTSAGSVVGAAYASGLSAARIRQAAFDLEVSSMLDFTWSPGGMIRGEHLARWVNALTGQVPIERFPIRFVAVATDLGSGEPMLMDTGPAGRAAQASSAVPGMNVPVAYRGGHLIDGGTSSLLPVRIARALGADVVIAVDIYCQSPRANGMRIPSVLGRVMQTQSCLLAAPDRALADVLVAPTVGAPGMSARDAQERVLRAGYDSTREALQRWRDGTPSPALTRSLRLDAGRLDHAAPQLGLAGLELHQLGR